VATATETTRVRDDRRRLLSSLLDRLDDVTDTAFSSIREQIPAYGDTHDPKFLQDLREQIRLNFHTILTTLLEERTATFDDIAFARSAATRRARAGFALEDYVNAYRVGMQVLWAWMIDTAAETAAGRESALELAAPLMRYIDFASTHAAHAYVEFQQSAVADADRERRDLLELLLAGELPSGGPLLARAQSHGIGADARMLVVIAVPAGGEASLDTTQASTSAIARAAVGDSRMLVVGRQSEIVAVPVVRAGSNPEELCERIEAVHVRLTRDVAPLAVGISTVAAGVAEVARAYAEARAALDCGGGAPTVSALPKLAPFDYLLLRADETARRLVDPSLRSFLDEDHKRGGSLSATVEAFARADLNLRLAAEHLHVHPNTAQYRLRRIEERTGRSPRRVADLIDLLVAIALARRPDRDPR